MSEATVGLQWSGLPQHCVWCRCECNCRADDSVHSALAAVVAHHTPAIPRLDGAWRCYHHCKHFLSLHLTQGVPGSILCNIWVILSWYFGDTAVIHGWYSCGYLAKWARLLLCQSLCNFLYEKIQQDRNLIILVWYCGRMVKRWRR